MGSFSDRQRRRPTAAVVVTKEQIGQVRDCFDAMRPLRREFAEEFYRRFFELAPYARNMFAQDMEQQKLKLMDTIAALVGALDNPEMFRSIIEQIGHQHAQFGVTSSQLAAFGDALLWSLDRHFGASFTPERRQAWAALYAAVQYDMVQAMAAEPR